MKPWKKTLIKSSTITKEVNKIVITQKLDRYWPRMLVRTTELLIAYGDVIQKPITNNNNNNNAMENNEHINNSTPKKPHKSNERTPTKHAIRASRGEPPLQKAMALTVWRWSMIEGLIRDVWCFVWTDTDAEYEKKGWIEMFKKNWKLFTRK